MNFINTEKFIRNVVIIIILTNIPVVVTLPFFYSKAIGWILGSLGSIINFIWLSKNVKASFEMQEGKAKLKAVKGYYLRFVFLITYSVLIVWLIKPDIIVFGMGLLSYQGAIYIHEIVSRTKSNRYFRG